MAEQKTNVMRILEHNRINYTAYQYPHGDGAVDGVSVAALTGLEPSGVFKTLVARGAGKTPYVFVIPVACELDLKKAAKSVGEKSIAMLHVSELMGVTGYVRGGCSPVGMKKRYGTVLHESALRLELMTVSAGKIGVMVRLEPGALIGLIGAQTADITVSER